METSNGKRQGKDVVVFMTLIVAINTSRAEGEAECSKRKRVQRGGEQPTSGPIRENLSDWNMMFICLTMCSMM